MTPEPETLASIRLQGKEFLGLPIYRCGCEYRQQWHLCSYHEGYDDGVAAMRTDMEES